MRDDPDNAVWPNGDVLPLADYYQGTGGSSFKQATGDTTTDMECFTCHAAHDGVDAFMLRRMDDNSRICTGCHTDFVASTATPRLENPANYIAEYGEAPTARMGSHYTGTIVNSNTTIGEVRWAYCGVWTDTSSSIKQTSHWNASTNGGTGGLLANGSTASRGQLRMQCQSCHTPHDAATGLVEGNAYDGSITNIDYDNGSDAQQSQAAGGDFNFGTAGARMSATPTTALLLGSNARSKMCATCHWPIGTHVTTIYTVNAKPDPMRLAAGNTKKKYRDYCTRTSAFVVSVLNGEQEYQYNVYDLIADGNVTGTGFDGVRTPESPCNFPPLMPGKFNVNNSYTTQPQGEMLCDSCHAPHGAATGAGAFILEEGSGDAGSSLALGNQRVFTRNYQDLCWLCHDK
jgi:predicted CXXCH cytochrome family protein